MKLVQLSADLNISCRPAQASPAQQENQVVQNMSFSRIGSLACLCLPNPASRVLKGEIAVSNASTHRIGTINLQLDPHTHTQVRRNVLSACPGAAPICCCCKRSRPLSFSPPTAAGAPSKRLPGTPYRPARSQVRSGVFAAVGG